MHLSTCVLVFVSYVRTSFSSDDTQIIKRDLYVTGTAPVQSLLLAVLIYHTRIQFFFAEKIRINIKVFVASAWIEKREVFL